MKELDFDELDKAVNSLMGEVPHVNEQPSTDDTLSSPIITIPDSTPPQAQERTNMSSPVPDSSTKNPAPSSTPSPASRRGGRFMDVVHPSSDMKSSRNSYPSREGVSITPLSPRVEPTPATNPSQGDNPRDTPVTPVSLDTPSGNEWPDPIAVHEQKQSNLPSAALGLKSETPPVESSPMPASFEPLSTPFLPDTKVEKRPLGGGQVLDQAIADELSKPSTTEVSSPKSPSQIESPDSTSKEIVTPSAPALQETSAQLTIEPETKAPLPAELASDLVAIEAGGATTREHETAVAKPIETPPAAAAIGAGSIHQQYKEQPTTGDTSHAAIYDTETAQQPLLHPPKKKTGWLVTIWIVLIIILGIGVGAAVWYFGLI